MVEWIGGWVRGWTRRGGRAEKECRELQQGTGEARLGIGGSGGAVRVAALCALQASLHAATRLPSLPGTAPAAARQSASGHCPQA